MSLSRYPAYKPSGVEWLEQMPATWTMKRLKYVANRSEVKVDADDANPLPYIGLEHVESWTGRLLPLDEELIPTGISNYFKSRDILFGKLRPYLAKACHVDFEGLCSSELLVLRGKYYEPRFLLYQLLSQDFINLVDSSTYGSKMPRASWDFIGSCELPLPPLEEQQTIADFLDTQTAKIDTLLAKKRQFIAKLREKRSALIARTVTRGLPPAAAQAAGLEPHPAMKDSGVEWLNNVPAHWQIVRSRFLLTVSPSPVRLHNLEDSDEVSFVPMEAVSEYGGLNLEHSKPIGEIGSGYTEFEDGDVVIAKITPCFENYKSALACNLLNGVAFGTTELHVLRANHELDKCFLFYVTISHIYRKLGESEMYGAGGQKRVPTEFVKDFRIPLPPLAEQQAIAAYLDRETARIDQLTAKVEAAIARLTEYRQALITAAVTGKIDVRARTVG